MLFSQFLLIIIIFMKNCIRFLCYFVLANLIISFIIISTLFPLSVIIVFMINCNNFICFLYRPSYKFPPLSLHIATSLPVLLNALLAGGHYLCFCFCFIFHGRDVIFIVLRVIFSLSFQISDQFILY